ncbi:MAG TPA: GFA family protein [Acetobacteraceae bacterium]|jgi:hypothetical protein|nr:GFA family protein [Acetobacteraceae bacterium]
MPTYQGACFCGAITIEATGAPFVMGYCHCRSCRSWSAGPVNALTLWRENEVRVTGGGEHLASFARTDRSHRQFCRLCGGHVMTRHPRGGHIDVYAATIPDLAFVPTLHAHYQETVLPMRDGLPKFRDVPAEFGGSGEVMAE